MEVSRSGKLTASLLLLGLCHCHQALGQTAGMLLTKYRVDIEGHIMNGYGEGWRHCDVIHDASEQLSLSEETPNLVMDTRNSQSLDVRAAVARWR